MKKLIILIILGFGIYLVWGNFSTKEEDGHYNVSFDKAGIQDKAEKTANKISSEAKAVEQKFRK